MLNLITALLAGVALGAVAQAFLDARRYGKAAREATEQLRASLGQIHTVNDRLDRVGEKLKERP